MITLHLMLQRLFQACVLMLQQLSASYSLTRGVSPGAVPELRDLARAVRRPQLQSNVLAERVSPGRHRGAGLQILLVLCDKTCRHGQHDKFAFGRGKEPIDEATTAAAACQSCLPEQTRRSSLLACSSVTAAVEQYTHGKACRRASSGFHNDAAEARLAQGCHAGRRQRHPRLALERLLGDPCR